MVALRAFEDAGFFPLSTPLINRLTQNDASLRELGGFGSHTVDQISSAIVENITVTAFKFNNCGLNDEDCSAIMQALIFRHAHRINKFCVTCRPRTKRISFARNNIGVAGAEQIARFICSPSVHSLDERGDLDPSPYYNNKAICVCGKEALYSPRFLEDFIRLELLSNNIGDDGATAVADAIAACDANKNVRSQCIVELGCERNSITDIGLMSISGMLKTNSSIHTLHIGRNAFSHEGMVYLADALKTNNTLEVLSLTGNNAIGDEGAKFLGKALKYNTTLKTLLLKKCGISDLGEAYLVEALYSNTSPDGVLKNINHSLTECSTRPSEAQSLRSLSLRTLLGWNNLGRDTARRLKLGYFLCSSNGVRQVHSLELDRKVFPALLYKLWKIDVGEYSNRIPTNLEVIWSYLRDMPQVVEQQKPLIGCR